MLKILSSALFLFLAGCSCHTHRSSDMRAMMVPENLSTETSSTVLPRVYFAFDSAELSTNSKSIIRENLALLKTKGNPQVELGGHCDERGTNEYNIVLGMNRAESTLDYIAKLGGASPRQFTAMSYGEDMPLNSGHDERAWAENRSVEFSLK